MGSKSMLTAGIAAMLLAGCETTPPAATPPADGPGAMCNADKGQSFVGKTADDATVENIRKATGAGSVRVTKPGQPVTMDYRVDRVNIETDDNKIILSVRCG